MAVDAQQQQPTVFPHHWIPASYSTQQQLLGANNNGPPGIINPFASPQHIQEFAQAAESSTHRFSILEQPTEATFQGAVCLNDNISTLQQAQGPPIFIDPSQCQPFPQTLLTPAYNGTMSIYLPQQTHPSALDTSGFQGNFLAQPALPSASQHYVSESSENSLLASPHKQVQSSGIRTGNQETPEQIVPGSADNQVYYQSRHMGLGSEVNGSIFNRSQQFATYQNTNQAQNLRFLPVNSRNMYPSPYSLHDEHGNVTGGERTFRPNSNLSQNSGVGERRYSQRNTPIKSRQFSYSSSRTSSGETGLSSEVGSMSNTSPLPRRPINYLNPRSPTVSHFTPSNSPTPIKGKKLVLQRNQQISHLKGMNLL